jgi:hypothetical protein
LKIIEDCSLSLFKEDYREELVSLKLEGIINSELELTTKGMELLQSIEGKKTKSIDYDKLHLTLQNKLLSLTGKKQFMVGGKYSFIPNKIDMTTKLKGVITKYKLKDFNKIEKLLTLHIEKSVRDNFKYSILLGYYISKDGKSTLATDYESFEENEKEEVKENIEPKEIKNLF